MNDTNAQIIINYIDAILRNRSAVLLFNTWMGDKSEAQLKEINISDLTKDDIKQILGKNSFTKNECLKIFNSAMR